MARLNTISKEVFSIAAAHWHQFFKTKPANKYVWGTVAANDFLMCDPAALSYFNLEMRTILVPSQESKRRFEMLASPHYETLLKAYEIKHGPIKRPLTSTHASSV